MTFSSALPFCGGIKWIFIVQYSVFRFRVVNHDAHRVQRPLEARKAQSLPPPRRNGYLVTSEYLAPDRDRGRYHGDEGQARKEEASHSRQLSLPFKNTKGDNITEITIIIYWAPRFDHVKITSKHQNVRRQNTSPTTHTTL